VSQPLSRTIARELFVPEDGSHGAHLRITTQDWPEWQHDGMEDRPLTCPRLRQATAIFKRRRLRVDSYRASEGPASSERDLHVASTCSGYRAEYSTMNSISGRPSPSCSRPRKNRSGPSWALRDRRRPRTHSRPPVGRAHARHSQGAPSIKAIVGPPAHFQAHSDDA
jgi:hypothetical protein